MSNQQPCKTSLSLKSTIKNCVIDTLRTYAMDTNESLLRRIDPDSNIRLNSVNVVIGKQSSGKTTMVLEEIIKLSVLDTHHLLIYVTKDGNESDKTFLALKNLFQIPYVTISESDAEDYIQLTIKAKNLYSLVLRDNLQEQIDDDQKRDMFEQLSIENFDRPTLHTLVLFDDISNSKLFRDEGSYFSQLIRRCRHINFSFFLLIQGWRGLKPHIKNEISTLFIFPNFNRQQLSYIYSQSASNLSTREFQDMYQRMQSIKNNNPELHPYMIVDVVDGGNTWIEDN